jgi:hypothetical protein
MRVTQMSREYTAEDRERWREEIRAAKATMTKDEFKDWLNRRVNSAAPNL